MRGSPQASRRCTGQIFGLTEGLLIHEVSGEGNIYPYLAWTKGLFILQNRMESFEFS